MCTDHCMQLDVNVIKMVFLALSFANAKTVTILMVDVRSMLSHLQERIDSDMPCRLNCYVAKSLPVIMVNRLHMACGRNLRQL